MGSKLTVRQVAQQIANRQIAQHIVSEQHTGDQHHQRPSTLSRQGQAGRIKRTFVHLV